VNWSGVASACPWCGAPYVFSRHLQGVVQQATCRCPVWTWTATTTTTTTPATSTAPVREQTTEEAIETLEQKVDRLTLELARLRRENGEAS
jgi:hypothetical protein